MIVTLNGMSNRCNSQSPLLNLIEFLRALRERVSRENGLNLRMTN
jgi:hypothetical protein